MIPQIGLACGEVPWEREVLEAIRKYEDSLVSKRYVDMKTIQEDVRTGIAPQVLIVSPAVRGFAEKAIDQCRSANIRVVVLLDGIRPPWLLDSSCETYEFDDVNLDELLQTALDRETALPVRIASKRDSELVAFFGVSGGVGTTSMAWLAATSSTSNWFLESNTVTPSASMLLGLDATEGTMLGALQGHDVGRILTQPLCDPIALSIDDVDVLRTNARLLVVDAGSDWADAESLLQKAGTVVLVGDATPLGLVRLVMLIPRLVGAVDHFSVIVNRVRPGVAASKHVARAICDVVERECGVRPVLVEDDRSAFDAGWLHLDWSQARAASERVQFALASAQPLLLEGAKHNQAA